MAAALGIALNALSTSAEPAAIDGAKTLTGGESPPSLVELAQAEPSATTLPGGASSLRETYQDWQVACAQQGSMKRCAMSQQQIDAKTRQRLLAIEITPVAGNQAEALLMLPFGLLLDAGVALQIDDGAIQPPVRFRTCLPGGCLVPLRFDAATLARLRKGTALKLVATAEGGAATAFSISLRGFGMALDRIMALAR